MENLPVYEPKFLWDRNEEGHRVGGVPSLRMTVLWVPEDSRPRGGLAIVWGESGDFRDRRAKKLLASRLPAVMALPDMWMTDIKSIRARDFPAKEWDLTWTLTSDQMAWSEDEEHGPRALGGSFLPTQNNLLLAMSPHIHWTEHVSEIRRRAEALCQEHCVPLPEWWSGLPQSVFFTAKLRAFNRELRKPVLDVEDALRKMDVLFGRDKYVGDVYVRTEAEQGFYIEALTRMGAEIESVGTGMIRGTMHEKSVRVIECPGYDRFED